MRKILFALIIFMLVKGAFTAAEEDDESANLSNEDIEIIRNLEILRELEMLKDMELLENYDTIKDIEALKPKGEIYDESKD